MRITPRALIIFLVVLLGSPWGVDPSETDILTQSLVKISVD